jgi:hypothetical protein
MTKLPPPSTLTNLIGDLIGQRVTSKASPASRPDPRKHVAATYRNEAGDLVAVAVCDLPIAASFAAALTMVPAVRVDECVKDGRLDDILRENLHEVFNVLSAAFPMSGAPRVVLHDMRCHEDAPADLGAVLTSPSSRVDLEISVGGYRSGKFVLLAA